MNTTDAPRIRVRLTPTEYRRLANRRDRYACRRECAALRRTVAVLAAKGTEGR